MPPIIMWLGGVTAAIGVPADRAGVGSGNSSRSVSEVSSGQLVHLIALTVAAMRGFRVELQIDRLAACRLPRP